jgi:hypothetical protein
VKEANVMSNKKPLSASFLLCEDVRPELNGKVTINGLFPGAKVLLLTKPKTKKAKGTVGRIDQLAILAMIENGSGSFPVTLLVKGPAGEKILEGKIGDVLLAEGRTALLAFRMLPLIVPTFGSFRAEFTVGESVLPFEFHIEGVASLPIDAGPTKVKAKIKRRSRSHAE